MRIVSALAFVAGLALITALVASSGFAPVGEAVASVGWGVALVALVRVAEMTMAGWAWWLLFPAALRPRLGVCVLLRWIRESVNSLLPVAQIGGEIAGARVLTFFGAERALGAASIIADVLVLVATQFLFTVVGVVVLVLLGGDGALVRFAAAGLLVAAPAIGGFYLVQRRGTHRLARRLLARFVGDRPWLALGAVDSLYARLEIIHANRRGIVLSATVHTAVWFLGAMEVWIALAFMGWPVGYAQALVIESLAQAVKGAAFVVPAALGVQEGGFIALAAVFGIPAAPAVALSLVKRFADIVLGLPGLLVWQALEGRRILWRPKRRPAPRPSARQQDAAH